ncbi:MAG: hypothetical protein COA99_07270 [Moraxellaceae bacterium]|nr:MAG: hypothetical protein COA99_07270 [Moraxellaceae bacterium]
MKTHTIYPIPRVGLILLLVTVSLAIASHALRLPVGVFVAAIVCLVWRIQVFRERWVFPGKTVRFFMVIASFVTVFLYYGTILGPDAGVTLLILAYLFKLLEMYKERDAFFIVILSYFVVATNYLFSTSLLSSLYTFVVVLMVTASLVGLNQSRKKIRPKRTLLIAAKLSIQAIPVMLILFVFVPRVSPIWSLNVDSDQATTGLSDSVSPGDISSLSKSDELVFTAEFNGDKPIQEELYWRGVTYSDFDGRTWSRGLRDNYESSDSIELDNIDYSKKLFEFQIIMQPNYRHWLFSLPFSTIDLPYVKLTDSLVFERKEAVSTLLSYRARSHPEYVYQRHFISPTDRERNTRLPATDIRAKRKAIQMIAKVAGDHVKYADSVLNWFNTANFVYTLQPPALKVNTIDGFLFSTKQGFCGHYAGAFVFMMRAVGIPARMIGGYQGGDYHSAGHLMVKQYHAHAWTEIWLRGKGWVRVDPTRAVAPERIISGPEYVTSDSSFLTDSPLSPRLFRNSEFISSLRSRLEHIDYLWSRWVVGYNNSTQMEFLSRWINNVTPQKVITIMLMLLCGVMAVLSIYVLLQRGKQKLNPVDALFLRYCDKLAEKGLSRMQGEGVWIFYQRAANHFPAQADAFCRITQLYDDLRYGPPGAVNGENNHDVSVTLATQKNALKREIRRLHIHK